MKKAKIFVNDERPEEGIAKNLESYLNLWLSNHPNIAILSVIQSSTYVEVDVDVLTMITIIYEEYEK